MSLAPGSTAAIHAFHDAMAGHLRQAAYRHDPVAYCADAFGLTLWGKQQEVARALLEPPHKVLVKSANGIGKTALAGGLASWFYRCFDPGICIVTGPKFDQVKDTTFKEIRRHLSGSPGMMPKNPRVESSPTHYINGMTSADATSFQGIHGDAILLIFEECIGVAAQFWEAARGIMAGGSDLFWLAICNPTDNSSQAYLEEMSGRWTVISISAFDHPNIAAELCGNAPPIPSAVRLGQLVNNMGDWGEWVSPSQAVADDLDLNDPATYGLAAIPDAMRCGIAAHFPEPSWRPSPIGEARILGRYPTQATSSIFAEAAFNRADRSDLDFSLGDVVRVGCDVARFGDDATTIHVRRGPVSLEHRNYRKQDTAHTAGVLKEIARAYAPASKVEPEHVPILIDDTGVGGGVVDQRGEFNFIAVNAGQKAIREDKYPNARSETMFTLAERMGQGLFALRHLPHETRVELRRQALGMLYRLDSAGRRVAESKDQTKKRLGRSPDDLDSVTLAYYPYGGPPVKPTPIAVEHRGAYEDRGGGRDLYKKR